MTHREITVPHLFDDDGESYYILPSGFENSYILVNESPVDLLARHITQKERDALLRQSP